MAASTDKEVGSTKLVTYAKARYKAKLSSWLLWDLEDIDKLFYSFHTKAIIHMRAFLYDLLYLNQ